MLVAYLLKIIIPVLFLAYGAKVHYQEKYNKNREGDLDTINELNDKILLLTKQIELGTIREDELGKEIKAYQKYLGEVL